MNPRKTTKFTICASHRAMLAGAGRSRVAEIFCEGGPAQARPCTAPGCRVAPGVDLYVAELCNATYDTNPGSPFAWAANTTGGS
jgi:hypothetical protein